MLPGFEPRRKSSFELDRPLVRILAGVVLTCVLGPGCTTVTRESENFSVTQKPDRSYLDTRLEKLQAKAKEYPKREDYLYQIASVYFEKEDYRNAALYLNRAIALRPDQPKYHYHLGRVYLRIGETELAEASFRDAQKLTDTGRFSGMSAALGFVLAKQGELDAAEDAFRQAVSAEPENPEPYYFLGAVCDMAGKKEEAIRNFREYLARGGRLFRSNTVFYLEKLGVEVDEDALERARPARRNAP